MLADLHRLKEYASIDSDFVRRLILGRGSLNEMFRWICDYMAADTHCLLSTTYLQLLMLGIAQIILWWVREKIVAF